MSDGKKKNFIRYTPEQLAAIPSVHQVEQMKELAQAQPRPVRGTLIGGGVGAVTGHVFGVGAGAGAIIGGAAGLLNEATRKK